MNALESARLSRDEARTLTDELKADAERLWAKLLEAYEGGAHLALGYSSWGVYFEAEFGGSDATAYRLLQTGRVMTQLPIGSPRPATESQARELAPLLDRPEVLRETWAQVVEMHPEPTAADVREVVQARMDVHYSSKTPEWSTPPDLFAELHAEFRFDLDVCASPGNAKCATFYDRELDGLSQPWKGTCWMNPPYGDEIVKWVAKAHESGQQGATVVCLVPARVDTGWWWDYCRRGEIRFLRGRLKFGGGDSAAPFPSALVIFGPRATPLLPKYAERLWWERAA